MENLSFYFSIFRRRLPYFLIVATIVSAISVTVAYTLPPAYVSKMILLVESPQIPAELAASTVRTPAFEQLQIVQQRLLTRSNMLDIARRMNVLPNVKQMNPDQIVDAMRARTKIETSNRRRQEAPLMTVSFEAPQAQTAAAVLNEYLTLIQLEDSKFRKGRSGGTLVYFTQEVKRLNDALEGQSALILKFKQDNSDALPSNLNFRVSQKASQENRLIRIARDATDLKNRHERLMQLYELTGKGSPEAQLTPEERQLKDLREKLDVALITYSAGNPRVKQLEARIAQIEARIESRAKSTETEGAPETEADQPLPAMLTIQLSEIASRLAALEEEAIAVQAQLAALDVQIAKTPKVAIELEELNRKYASILSQYNQAEARLTRAQTGDRIETRSRGQRIAVIEQPAIPSQPTKPNRALIAGGGTLVGILAGLALILLMEALNNTARRPEDIVNRLGVTPLTTIPYIRTRGQRFRQRSAKLLVILAILVGIPAAVYAVHIYYLPLDLIADRVMNKMGVRW